MGGSFAPRETRIAAAPLTEMAHTTAALRKRLHVDATMPAFTMREIRNLNGREGYKGRPQMNLAEFFKWILSLLTQILGLLALIWLLIGGFSFFGGKKP
jgi:hypothetical protein